MHIDWKPTIDRVAYGEVWRVPDSTTAVVMLDQNDQFPQFIGVRLEDFHDQVCPGAFGTRAQFGQTRSSRAIPNTRTRVAVAISYDLEHKCFTVQKPKWGVAVSAKERQTIIPARQRLPVPSSHDKWRLVRPRGPRIAP